MTKFNLGGQHGETNTVSEAGLYKLIMRSRKENAKPFQRWVTHEVLPTIRKHGAYMSEKTIEQALTSPDFLIKLATQLKGEKEARKQAEAQLEQAKPKLLFADAVETSNKSILVGVLATILRANGVQIGQKRLFQALRENGFLCSTGSRYNLPTQKRVELGLFEVKETTVVHADGHKTINLTPKVTGKGQVYFVNYFLKKPVEGR
ncbi:anti-repressor protein [Aeriscardovia aeriphila]|nr:anti-repressor protein [Aeriscardovia aeriphila]